LAYILGIGAFWLQGYFNINLQEQYINAGTNTCASMFMSGLALGVCSIYIFVEKPFKK
jgi:hypothetical protein